MWARNNENDILLNNNRSFGSLFHIYITLTHSKKHSIQKGQHKEDDDNYITRRERERENLKISHYR